MFDNRDFYVRAHWVSEWFVHEQPLLETAKLVEQLGKTHEVRNAETVSAL
jgi:hypothetical protein